MYGIQSVHQQENNSLQNGQNVFIDIFQMNAHELPVDMWETFSLPNDQGSENPARLTATKKISHECW